jgi:predicted Zn-dependent protease with MMP-like domain
LAPPEIPLSLTRAEQFDELVLDSVERLERKWPQLAGVEFAVEEVPPPGAELLSDEPVPLGRVVQPGRGEPARIVVYRRPLEVRAPGRADLGLLVHDIVVELVADLLGLDPEIVDPE